MRGVDMRKEEVKGRERAVAEGGRHREGGEREGRLGGEGKDRDREGQAGNVGRRGGEENKRSNDCCC